MLSAENTVSLCEFLHLTLRARTQTTNLCRVRCESVLEMLLLLQCAPFRRLPTKQLVAVIRSRGIRGPLL